MLKKLEFYYDEDNEKIDIFDEKIYWDTLKNQFRHKFNCDKCNTPLGCICYDSLESARRGVDDGLLCDSCWFDFVSQDFTIQELIGELDSERIGKVFEYIENVVTGEEIKEYMQEEEVERVDIDDKIDIVDCGDKSDELRDLVVKLLTDDEKRTICYNCGDGCCEGDACNV